MGHSKYHFWDHFDCLRNITDQFSKICFVPCGQKIMSKLWLVAVYFYYMLHTVYC